MDLSNEIETEETRCERESTSTTEALEKRADESAESHGETPPSLRLTSVSHVLLPLCEDESQLVTDRREDGAVL